MPIRMETAEQTISRLETNLSAARLNHELLLAAGPVVDRNNERLRGGMARIADQASDNPDLRGIAGGLREALAVTLRYERPVPPDFSLDDDDKSPEDPSERIAWLEERLRACRHANYLLQEQGAPTVWNSDDLREVLRTLASAYGDVEGAENAVADMQAMLGRE